MNSILSELAKLSPDICKYEPKRSLGEEKQNAQNLPAPQYCYGALFKGL